MLFPSFRRLVPAALVLSLLLNACSNASQQHESNKVAYDATTPAAATTESAGSADTTDPQNNVTGINSPARKIIREADIRCRVNDVFTATTALEQLVAAFGGQTSESHLNNSIDESKVLPYKPDSNKRVQSYTTTARLTLRVPYRQLDSLLSAVAHQSAFIDNRNLMLDDVTLQYLSNKLRNEALGAGAGTRQAQQLARRTNDAIAADDHTVRRQETIIDRKIENQRIDEQATYATLKVALYQPQRLDAVIIGNTATLMNPTFGQQLKMAWSTGWDMLQNILLFCLQIWPLIIIGLAITWIVRAAPGKRIGRWWKGRTVAVQG